jgi:plastocyanin
MRRLWIVALTALFVVGADVSAGARVPITISESGLSDSSVTVKLGRVVSWSNQLDRQVQVVSEPFPYWSVPLDAGATGSVRMKLAGTWTYTLEDDPSVVGTVRVPPQLDKTTVSVGESFVFTGATAVKSGYTYDVVRRRIGSGSLFTVAGGIKTRTVTFKIGRPGTYLFAMRTFGFDPDLGYDLYTAVSPRVEITVTP